MLAPTPGDPSLLVARGESPPIPSHRPPRPGPFFPLVVVNLLCSPCLSHRIPPLPSRAQQLLLFSSSPSAGLSFLHRPHCPFAPFPSTIYNKYYHGQTIPLGLPAVKLRCELGFFQSQARLFPIQNSTSESRDAQRHHPVRLASSQPAQPGSSSSTRPPSPSRVFLRSVSASGISFPSLALSLSSSLHP
ncbi:hypothetical protein LZ30DRAFT_19581 [Colletotrichum cereale]|nr:hypothetical protein LZ30DRAFT_19581 [Colletotrichum cereale]